MSHRPLPPLHPTSGPDDHDTSLYITLPVRIHALTVSTRARKTPEVQQVCEYSFFEDASLAVYRFNLDPCVLKASVGIDLEGVIGKEDVTIFFAKLGRCRK